MLESNRYPTTEKLLTKKAAAEFMGFPSDRGYKYISELVQKGYIAEVFAPLTPRPRYRLTDLLALAKAKDEK